MRMTLPPTGGFRGENRATSEQKKMNTTTAFLTLGRFLSYFLSSSSSGVVGFRPSSSSSSLPPLASWRRR